MIFSAVVLVALDLSGTTLFVALNGTNATPPFATWATAATNIQDAVDAANDRDTVIVTNGIYGAGGKVVLESFYNQVTNRVAVQKPLTLMSVNGPQFTTIAGYQVPGTLTGDSAVRCVYLAGGALLSGFTLSGGATHSATNVTSDDQYGAGAYCSGGASISNCVLSGNVAYAYGGGVFSGTLYNCTLVGNWVQRDYGGGGGANGSILYNCKVSHNSAAEGGGVRGGTLYNCLLTENRAGSGGGVGGGFLYNCTVVSNSASSGGGVTGYPTPGYPMYSILKNCIVYYNSATNGPNYSGTGLYSLDHCCTYPTPDTGTGNISAPPLFMDVTNGDFRLSKASPCIDAGTNLVGSTITLPPNGPFPGVTIYYNCDPVDIEGNTRFIDGNGDGIVAWDLGAYEFNSFAPPRFTAEPQLTAAGWRLSLTGARNTWMRVEKSSNLKDWSQVWSGFITAEGEQEVTDSDTTPRVMFYRVVSY